jgi:hypothetical protein
MFISRLTITVTQLLYIYIYIYIYYITKSIFLKKIYLTCYHYKVKNNTNEVIQAYMRLYELSRAYTKLNFLFKLCLFNKQTDPEPS